MKKMLISILFVISLGLISACSPPSPDNNNNTVKNITTDKDLTLTTVAPDYQWIQLGEQGAVIARAVFKKSGQNCPAVDTVDQNGNSSTAAMQPRTQNMPENFDVTVCETTLAANLKSAEIAQKKLPLPTKSPKKVAVIGDTGCRIKGKDVQNCNDPNPTETTGWDFVKTAKDAAALNPDLVIHVGDYIYRESECEDAGKCGGSPYGDNWATWEIDFLKPAKPLLENVPLVFARGNHESCQREFRGWYLFLDPRSLKSDYLTNCVTASDPFNVALDKLDLLVLDSSNEGDLNDYNEAAIKNLKGSNPVWVVTHVPFYGISHYGNFNSNNDVKTAIQNSKVEFLVSGHIHFFEMVLFDKTPSQMIAGGGATELDHKVSDAEFQSGLNELGAIGADKNDPAKPASEIIDKFTFSFIDVEDDKWKITVMGQDGKTEKATYTIKR